MKVLAYMPLHYGLPWLYETLFQLLPQVDKLVILYTRLPSCGHETLLPCPDSREDLRALVEPFMEEYPDKIIWRDGIWKSEHEHTQAAWDYADGYDFILRVDADEIYPDGMIENMVYRTQAYPDVRIFRFPFIHFWQSLDYVCFDEHYPYRLERNSSTAVGWEKLETHGKWWVYHMGYCQPTEYIHYKLTVSYHKPEFRADWFNDKWLAGAKTNLHPVEVGLWNAERFNRKRLPDVFAVNLAYVRE